MKLILVLFAVLFALTVVWAVQPTALPALTTAAPILQPVRELSIALQRASGESMAWFQTVRSGRLDLSRTPISVILLVVNVVSMLAFAIDKKTSRSRASDAYLIPLSCCGPFGAMLGMLLCNHMTSTKLYLITVNIMLIVQTLLFLHFAV